MKIFQKTGVAVLVMCIAIAAAVGIGLWRQPAAAVGSQTGSLDTGLDTAYYAKFVDDGADCSRAAPRRPSPSTTPTGITGTTAWWAW